MSIEIRTPITPKEWEEYYALRYEVLRKPLGQAVGSERNEGDLNGRHFALYENHVLKGIVRLDETIEGHGQVRFLAISTNAQGRGFGKMLMLEMEDFSKKKGHTKMILHARENAVNFYLGLGYDMVEKSHLLFGQVQHFLMEKNY